MIHVLLHLLVLLGYWVHDTLNPFQSMEFSIKLHTMKSGWSIAASPKDNLMMTYMRGPRKFCQRGSNFDGFFS